MHNYWQGILAQISGSTDVLGCSGLTLFLCEAEGEVVRYMLDRLHHDGALVRGYDSS